MLHRLVPLTTAFLLAVLSISPGPSAPGASAAPAVQARPDTLRVGLIPNIDPEKQRANYKSFGEYLSQTIGIPVELFVATDYTGVVEALASERIDMAYFGGLTYIQAEQRGDLYPIVTEIDRETGTTKYYSAIITRVDSPIQTTADIGGRKFAFGDVNSTSGSLYPRVMLDRVGIGDFENPSTFVYTGGHDATTLAVQNGTVDARTAEEVLGALRRLNRERGATVLVSLHQPELALEHCPRILVLSGGTLAYDGPPDGIDRAELYALGDDRQREEDDDAARRPSGALAGV